MSDLVTNALAALFGGLLVFFIDTLGGRRIMADIADEKLKNHNESKHQETIRDAISEHEAECPARQEMRSVKTALTFLVTKSGGNPVELGL